ncbi:hypothetical protein SAMN06295964_0006 [Aeromicrobium choanae]|uniref:Uncharacterized protein n=2 Tax=Aeromicrobium choanae TaxID=1736691 RepID=A0A1T4YMZ9_9ACTN|nr:hypothetical protein SAMN06295964_0006 [Aeromicrobium choanae]
MTSQVILGLAWAAAAIAAGSAALTLRDPLPRVSFGLTALLTGYLAWVALGPSADEELVYPFTALRLFPVVAILYVLAFWAVVRTERSAT